MRCKVIHYDVLINCRSRGTVVNLYDLTTCPSWAQTPNKPPYVGLITILLWGEINKSLKSKPTIKLVVLAQALTDNGC